VRQRRETTIKTRAINVLAGCALNGGRFDEARRHYRRVLAIATSTQNAHDTAVALDHLALVAKHMSNYDEALRLSLESLVQHRRIGDSAGVALCLNNLGSHYLSRRDPEAAAPHLHEGLAICERDGLVGTSGYILANLTEVAMKIGDARAENFAERAVKVASATGNRAVLSWMNVQLARMSRRRGDLDAARMSLATGLNLAIALGHPALRTDALLAFVEILESQGELPCARQVLEFAIDHPSTSSADRDQLGVELARFGGVATERLPAIGMEELLHRIVLETQLSYAPLIATLRGER